MEKSEKRTFADIGFLSDGVVAGTPDRRQANAPWFDLVEEANRCLQSTAMKASQTITGTPFERLPMALLLLHRSCAQLQGAILMAERGMDVEARTLARGLLENAFLMAALHDNPDAARKVMWDDMDAAKKGQAKAIIKQGLSADIDKLQAAVASFGKVTNASPAELAELGPLNKLYLLYRVMSDDAVHPSGKSLRRHMKIADDGKSWNGFLVGPENPEKIALTLDQLLMIAIPLGVAFQQMVSDTENNSWMGEISERYQPLRVAREAAEPAA